MVSSISFCWQLTDFGLSKVGLINSTDDLSGPAVSGASLLEEVDSQLSASQHQQERRSKRSAVGTPDYLAPEILLGTGHGLSLSDSLINFVMNKCFLLHFFLSQENLHRSISCNE